MSESESKITLLITRKPKQPSLITPTTSTEESFFSLSPQGYKKTMTKKKATKQEQEEIMEVSQEDEN